MAATGISFQGFHPKLWDSKHAVMFMVFKMTKMDSSPLLNCYIFTHISQTMTIKTRFGCVLVAGRSYIWIIFFAFDFDMTTPKSLNTRMISSWSIAPNERRDESELRRGLWKAYQSTKCFRYG